MNANFLGFLVAVSLVPGLASATEMSVATPKTDQERIDSLIQQNQILTEMVTSLKADNERPRSREEVFAACMQAAKGSSAMAAESVGGHCDQLLKK